MCYIDLVDSGIDEKDLPETDRITLICGSSPNDLIKILTWCKNNPGVSFRKLIVPYSEHYDTYGEWYMHGCKSNVLASPRSFAKKYPFKLSPPIDRTGEFSKDIESLPWPDYDHYTLDSIRADALGSRRAWLCLQPSLGMSGLHDLLISLSPGPARAVVAWASKVSGLKEKFVLSELEKLITLRNLDTDILPDLKEFRKLPLLSISKDWKHIKYLVQNVLRRELKVNCNFLDEKQNLTWFEGSAIYIGKVEQFLKLWIEHQVMLMCNETDFDEEEKKYKLGSVVWDIRGEIFEQIFEESEKYKNVYSQFLDLPIKYVRPMHMERDEKKVMRDEVSLFQERCEDIIVKLPVLTKYNALVNH